MDESELAGAGDSDDGRARCDGELDGVGADAAGGADDQDGLAGRHAGGVQGTQRCESGDGHGRCLLVAQARGLVGELVLLCEGVLRERAAGDAEDLVADAETGHVGADRDDGAGDVLVGHGFFGLRTPKPSSRSR